jgi:hypothetical protein
MASGSFTKPTYICRLSSREVPEEFLTENPAECGGAGGFHVGGGVFGYGSASP